VVPKANLRDYDTAEVSSMIFRCKGVGQALVEVAIAKAQRFGLETVHLMAPPSLKGFFERAGFSKEDAPEQEQCHFMRTLEYAKTLVPERINQLGEAFHPTAVAVRSRMAIPITNSC
jgi:hypothetical protein